MNALPVLDCCSPIAKVAGTATCTAFDCRRRVIVVVFEAVTERAVGERRIHRWTTVLVASPPWLCT
jgi:hypothetical protein